MNVKQLRALIADMPDDAPVLVPAPDHSYRECAAEDGTAGMTGARRSPDFWEWFGEEHASEGEKPVRALVIR